MIRVLVLDDNEMSRFAIRAVLERAGYHCLEAETAEQALRAVRENGIDLLIADAVLRGARGPEIAQRLPGVPVLFISGYPLEHLVYQGVLDEGRLSQGDAAFLQKPFRPQALLDGLRALLKRGESS